MKTEIVETFIKALKELGLNPIEHDDHLTLEYAYEKELHKKVIDLMHDFIGFFKTIACHADHSRSEMIARWKCPYKFITGADLNDEQINLLVKGISNKIRVPA